MKYYKLLKLNTKLAEYAGYVYLETKTDSQGKKTVESIRYVYENIHYKNEASENLRGSLRDAGLKLDKELYNQLSRSTCRGRLDEMTNLLLEVVWDDTMLHLTLKVEGKVEYEKLSKWIRERSYEDKTKDCYYVYGYEYEELSR